MQQNCNKKRLKNVEFCEKSKNFEIFFYLYLINFQSIITFNVKNFKKNDKNVLPIKKVDISLTRSINRDEHILKLIKLYIMKASNTTTTTTKQVSRISEVSKNAKTLQRSLGATRSFLLEYAKELELTNFEIKFLNDSKKKQDIYEKLKSNVQFVKGTDRTCVYWVLRTLAKFEKSK